MFEFFRVTLKEKRKYSVCFFLFNETDVDSYFFHNFLDVYVVQNRVLRISEGLIREIYSMKEVTFEPSFGYQS